jgi:hypothetical protein
MLKSKPRQQANVGKVLTCHTGRRKISKVYLGSCVQLYSLAETPQLSPPPAFGLRYEGGILVSQDGRHLFVNAWLHACFRPSHSHF